MSVFSRALKAGAVAAATGAALVVAPAPAGAITGAEAEFVHNGKKLTVTVRHDGGKSTQCVVGINLSEGGYDAKHFKASRKTGEAGILSGKVTFTKVDPNGGYMVEGFCFDPAVAGPNARAFVAADKTPVPPGPDPLFQPANVDIVTVEGALGNNGKAKITIAHSSAKAKCAVVVFEEPSGSPETLDGNERVFEAKVINANRGKAKYTTKKLPAGDVVDETLIASATCFDSESLDFGFTVLNPTAP